MAQASIRRGFWVGVVLLAASSTVCAANAWRDNLTRDQVVAALGRPQSDLRGGNLETMEYPGGVIIKFQNGVVTSIEGPVPEALTPSASAPAAAAPVAAPPTPAPASATAEPATQSATPPPAAPPAATTPAAPASGKTTAAPATTENKESFDTTIEDYSKAGVIPNGALPEGLPKLPGMPSTKPEEPNDWTKANNLTGFIAGLLIKTLVMAAVLKGAFMYKEFPILWREVLLVGGGVALCNQVLAYLFTLGSFGEIAAMVQVDQLVAAIVLLTLIMNFTAAKQFPTAAGITLTAMIVNVAVSYAMIFF